MKITISEDSRTSMVMGFGGMMGRKGLEQLGGSSKGNEDGASITESIWLKEAVTHSEKKEVFPFSDLCSSR